MNYIGLVEFLSELQPGKGLANWKLERVEQVGVDDEGDMRFAVTISLGAVMYRADSYIPPKGLVRDVERIVSAEAKKHGI